MLTKDDLREIFLEICEKACIREKAVDAYRNALGKKLDEAGILRSSIEAEKAYMEAWENCLPWLVDGMVTDEAVRCINNDMEYVPIVSVPKNSDIDNLFQFARHEIAFVRLRNEVFDENSEEYREFFPYLFPMKACNVSGIICDKCDVDGEFYYLKGTITYILEDGSFVTVEEKDYEYEKDDDYEEYVFRKVVDACPSLALLDNMFLERSQGFFD